VTREQATAAIRRKTAAATAPALTDDEITALVDLAERRDGTWNLNKAAAEGWRWKAGKVAGGFSFSADGVMVDKTSLLAQCERMVAMYSRRVRSIRTDTALTPYERDWYG
jgi:hypothetical protein